jgi:hypothetical protein
LVKTGETQALSHIAATKTDGAKLYGRKFGSFIKAAYAFIL